MEFLVRGLARKLVKAAFQLICMALETLTSLGQDVNVVWRMVRIFLRAPSDLPTCPIKVNQPVFGINCVPEGPWLKY